MADVHIKGIKLLNKRYSTAEWTNGVSINGQVVIPKLTQGEIGLNTNTLEVKIGTSTTDQTWSQARLISADVEQTVTYYHKDGSSSSTPKDGEVYVCTSASISNSVDGSHDFTVEFKEISLVAPQPEIPDLVVTDTNSISASDAEVKVVTKVAEGDAEHEVDVTYGLAAKKDYVDKKSTITIVDNGSGDYISDIEKTIAADGGTTLTVSRASYVIDIPELSISDEAVTDGKYIAGIKRDAADDHKIIVTKKDLPVLPDLTGGSEAAEDASIVGGVTVSGHDVAVAKKTIKTGDSVISVSGDKTSITISADTYTKAQIDQKLDDVDAMSFKGVLVSGSTLPTTITANMNGDTYKVAEAGTYASQAAKVGDIFIADYAAKKWRYIPAADDIEDTWRNIKLKGSEILSSNINSGALNFDSGDGVDVTYSTETGAATVKYSHGSTSDVQDLSKSSRTYVDGLTFDEFGHVIGYTVGTEQDQIIDLPSASGGVTAGNLQLVSSLTLGEDADGDHVLSGTKKTLAAGAKIDVDDTDNVITFAHETTTRTDTTSTATPEHQGTFTAIDNVITDSTGHVTAVNLKTVTLPDVPEYVDTNTTYDLSAASNSTVAGSTSIDIKLNGTEQSTDDTIEDKLTLKVDAATTTPTDGLNIKVEGDTITLTGKATKALLGMIRAAYALEADDSNVTEGLIKTYSGTNNDRLYGVNVKKDGTAFVEVPWTDTHPNTGDKNLTQDLYAFGTDEYGHIVSASSVTVLDGNLA